MTFPNIDASVSAADLQAIKDAFANIKARLPFLVNLTNDERKSIVKTGSDSLTFVTKALSGAQANPNVFPGFFDRNVRKFPTRFTAPRPLRPSYLSRTRNRQACRRPKV